MININMEPIKKAIEKSPIKKREIAKIAGMEPDTLWHFLRSGKQLKHHLNAIYNLCDLFGIDRNRVIK
jgi:hypothetical protein